jgi:hypothetical protein
VARRIDREVRLHADRHAIEREPLASAIFVSAAIDDLRVDAMPERIIACADLEAPTNHKRRLAACRGAARMCSPRPQRRARGHVAGDRLRGRAGDTLQAEGTPTAGVSMPCCELFEAQESAYRSSVLGPGTVRVGCEAAMRFGSAGSAGFGITPEAVVGEARRLLATRFEVANA